MSGIATRTRIESLGLVITIIVTAPTNRKALRRRIEIEMPNTDLTCVASAVSREMISPDCERSKKAGSRTVRRRNTALRRSATTRSPSVTTV